MMIANDKELDEAIRFAHELSPPNPAPPGTPLFDFLDLIADAITEYESTKYIWDDDGGKIP